MGKHERRAYLQAIEPDILNEFCEVCGYARKYPIRLLNRKFDNIAPPARRRGAKPEYQLMCLDATVASHLLCQRSTLRQTA